MSAPETRSGPQEKPGSSVGQLTVAVTGPTGTLGHGLVSLLERDAGVGQVVGIATRPFDPGSEGWTKLRYIQADIRDGEAVRRAVGGADVVVHLAYSLYGIRQRERDLFEMNVLGSVNVARAAVEAGARRFVYASSAAVYGFLPRNSAPLTEDAPIEASSRHFYARHKAQTELRLRQILDGAPLDAYFFRPCAIVGPHAAGGALHLLSGSARGALGTALRPFRLRALRPPVPPPPVPLQFLHEEDAGQAFHLAVTGAGPPGTYNLAGEGVLEGAEVVHRLGLRALPLPPRVGRAIARGICRLPPVVPATTWPEAVSNPVIVDVSAARERLGWRPRYSSAEALEDSRASLGL